MAMEMGCDGVLINTAIAKAKNPFQMAEAMKYAVIAGRKSFLSGRIKKIFLGAHHHPKKVLFSFFFEVFFFIILFFFDFFLILLFCSLYIVILFNCEIFSIFSITFLVFDKNSTV